MMVTIRFKDKENLVADDLYNFKFKLDKKEKELIVYKDEERLGYFAEICGISLDDFCKELPYLKYEK